MKWSGKIGFKSSEPVEVSIGVYEHIITERKALGDVLEGYAVSNQNENNTPTDSLRINVTLSIIASPYSLNNMHNMTYATLRGMKWKIDRITPRGNRLELALGEQYHDRPED